MGTAISARPEGMVLVITDEADIRLLLAFNLRVAGFDVEVAADVDAALDLARCTDPRVAIVDFAIPGAMDACSMLRRELREVAIMAIAGRAREDDAALVYAAGADDYVSHPFVVSELVAHVTALARCTTERSLAAAVGGPGSRLRWRALELDTESSRVFVHGLEVALRPLEVKLLRLLLESPARVFTRGQLLTLLWGTAGGTRHAVDLQIRGLRDKLRAHGDVITRIPGIGYRLGPLEAPVVAIRRARG